jgi:hypothetical protein
MFKDKIKKKSIKKEKKEKDSSQLGLTCQTRNLSYETKINPQKINKKLKNLIPPYPMLKLKEKN